MVRRKRRRCSAGKPLMTCSVPPSSIHVKLLLGFCCGRACESNAYGIRENKVRNVSEIMLPNSHQIKWQYAKCSLPWELIFALLLPTQYETGIWIHHTKTWNSRRVAPCFTQTLRWHLVPRWRNTIPNIDLSDSIEMGGRPLFDAIEGIVLRCVCYIYIDWLNLG